MLEVSNGCDKWDFFREINVMVSRPFVLHQCFTRGCRLGDRRHLYANISQVLPLENVLGVVKWGDQYGKQFRTLGVFSTIG